MTVHDPGHSWAITFGGEPHRVTGASSYAYDLAATDGVNLLVPDDNDPDMTGLHLAAALIAALLTQAEEHTDGKPAKRWYAADVMRAASVAELADALPTALEAFGIPVTADDVESIVEAEANRPNPPARRPAGKKRSRPRSSSVKQA